MKYLVTILMLIFSTMCFADNTPILSEDLTITMTDVNYQGKNLGYTVTLKYNGNGSWYLYSAVPINPNLTNVDDAGYSTDAVIAEINMYRTNGAPCSAGGLTPLTWNKELSAASLDHSIDMAINNYFSHTGLDGSSPWSRVTNAGFTGTPLGENIAAGYSVKTVVAGWINSPGHCSNIMNPQANVMGYGWAAKSQTDWGVYHTMITGVN